MESLQAKESRVVYLDAMRVFCSFAVIVMHISAAGMSGLRTDGHEWRMLSVFDSVTRFCAPVFIMISGALFLRFSEKADPKRLFKRNLPRLLAAYGFWSLAYAFFSVAGRYYAGGGYH